MNIVEGRIKAALGKYGLQDSVVITRIEGKQAFAWPARLKTGECDHRLLHFALSSEWEADPSFASKAFHATSLAVREPWRPSLQVAIHPNPHYLQPGPDAVCPDCWYFLELDLDWAAPSIKRPWDAVIHGVQVMVDKVRPHRAQQSEAA